MAVQTYLFGKGEVANRQQNVDQLYNLSFRDNLSGAQKYAGVDFRGRPISESNMGQYLIDSAHYNKAIQDFGITARPYWNLPKVNPFNQMEEPRISFEPPSGNTGGFSQLLANQAAQNPAGYQISGDIVGASNYLRSQGINNFNFAPQTSAPRLGQYDVLGQPFNSATNRYSAFTDQFRDAIFQANPDLKTNPALMAQVLQANPSVANQAWSWIDSNAQAAYQKEKAKDKGGLGVIAEGLGQVAQFAGLASGLHGLTAGLGALTSGAGLQGAFNAGMSAAGGMTDFGGVVGDIVGNTAIGNIANVGQAALTGGYEGGLPGALIGAGGATIGAGIGEAGGIGEFLSDPLGSIGGAFNVAAGGGVGGLLNTDNAMANAAQVGPGSLASNTPPVTGPIADEIVTVTASPVAGGAANTYGWLPSTLARHGIPLGAQLFLGESGGIQNWQRPDNQHVIRIGPDIPPDFINGQPTGSAVGGTGQGGTPETGGATGGQAQTGGGTGGASAIGGAVTDILGGGTGTSVIGSGTAGTGLAGGIPETIGVGGAGTTGAGMGGTGTAGTGATGGTGGLLDTSVTPTTPGGTTGTPTGTQPTLTDEELAAILAGGAAGVIAGTAGTGMGTGGTAGTGPVSGVGTVPTGTGPTAGTGTGVTPGTGMTTGTTGTAGGLSDAELAALLTGGAVGVGTGLGGADTGMATATGTGVGTTGVGTGAGGVGTGTGAGGTGGTGDGSGFGNGLDLLFPQMQGLLEMGFQPGTEADFGQYGPVGSIIKAGKSNIPQTPKRKKRGIRVNISGRARNA